MFSLLLSNFPDQDRCPCILDWNKKQDQLLYLQNFMRVHVLWGKRISSHQICEPRASCSLHCMTRCSTTKAPRGKIRCNFGWNCGRNLTRNKNCARNSLREEQLEKNIISFDSIFIQFLYPGKRKYFWKNHGIRFRNLAGNPAYAGPLNTINSPINTPAMIRLNGFPNRFL